MWWWWNFWDPAWRTSSTSALASSASRLFCSWQIRWWVLIICSLCSRVPFFSVPFFVAVVQDLIILNYYAWVGNGENVHKGCLVLQEQEKHKSSCRRDGGHVAYVLLASAGRCWGQWGVLLELVVCDALRPGCSEYMFTHPLWQQQQENSSSGSQVNAFEMFLF